MATMNSFYLLGDDDNEDPSHLIEKVQLQAVAQPKKPAANQAQAQPNNQAKLPSKPVPPSQAVREARNEGGRGTGRGGARGFGRGRGGAGGFNRDSSNNETSYGGNNGYNGGSKPSEGGETGKLSERRSYGGGPRGGFRGGRRGGYSNEEAGEGERPRRLYDRRSGTGHGNEFKRDGAGRGNWGTATDEISPEADESVGENEKNVNAEKQPGDKEAADANKESPTNESEEKEPEEKEMTLEEYEKVLEEKRKALLAMKPAEGRKVDEEEFKSMQQLSSKKSNDEIFIKWGSEKDKRRDASEKEERAKKSVSINEFLKPAEGESYYSGSGGRGRGRGRGTRGGYYGGNTRGDIAAPSIEDPGQFPTLGGK